MSLIRFPGYRQWRPVISLSRFIWLSPSLEDDAVSGCQQLQLQTGPECFHPNTPPPALQTRQSQTKDTGKPHRGDLYTRPKATATRRDVQKR